MKVKDQILMQLTLVDVGRVGLLPGLGALLLVARGGGLLAGLLLLSGSLSGRGLAGGGLGCSLGCHFDLIRKFEVVWGGM